jgi:hypothetical protein
MSQPGAARCNVVLRCKKHVGLCAACRTRTALQHVATGAASRTRPLTRGALSISALAPCYNALHVLAWLPARVCVRACVRVCVGRAGGSSAPAESTAESKSTHHVASAVPLPRLPPRRAVLQRDMRCLACYFVIARDRSALIALGRPRRRLLHLCAVRAHTRARVRVRCAFVPLRAALTVACAAAPPCRGGTCQCTPLQHIANPLQHSTAQHNTV